MQHKMPKDDGLIFLCLISYKIKTIVNLASSCTEISLNILVFYRIKILQHKSNQKRTQQKIHEGAVWNMLSWKFGLHEKGAKQKLYKYFATASAGDGIKAYSEFEVVKYTSFRFRLLRDRLPVLTRQEEQ